MRRNGEIVTNVEKRRHSSRRIRREIDAATGSTRAPSSNGEPGLAEAGSNPPKRPRCLSIHNSVQGQISFDAPLLGVRGSNWNPIPTFGGYCTRQAPDKVERASAP